MILSMIILFIGAWAIALVVAGQEYKRNRNKDGRVTKYNPYTDKW